MNILTDICFPEKSNPNKSVILSTNKYTKLIDVTQRLPY